MGAPALEDTAGGGAGAVLRAEFLLSLWFWRNALAEVIVGAMLSVTKPRDDVSPALASWKTVCANMCLTSSYTPEFVRVELSWNLLGPLETHRKVKVLRRSDPWLANSFQVFMCSAFLPV
jgi:hypothetical protein